MVLGMPTGAVALPGPAALRQHGVQLLEARRRRDRRHEVGARVFDQPLDLALVVALARTAEAVAEQVVADQLGEGARALALAVAADLGHRDLRVVVQDRQRHAAEEGERRRHARRGTPRSSPADTPSRSRHPTAAGPCRRSGSSGARRRSRATASPKSTCAWPGG